MCFHNKRILMYTYETCYSNYKWITYKYRCLKCGKIFTITICQLIKNKLNKFK